MKQELGGDALRAEWNRLIRANWRHERLEGIMRVRALLEISEGATTLDLMEMASNGLAPTRRPSEPAAFGGKPANQDWKLPAKR